MDLSKLFKERLEKIETLKNFIGLHGQRNQYINEIKDLSAQVNTVKELLSNCNSAVENFQKCNKQNYRNIIERAHKQQVIMLNIMEEMEDRNQNQTKNESVTDSLAVQNNNNILKEQNTNVRVTTPAQSFKLKPNETPVFNYSDYVKSPFTSRRMKPISLQFSDFERAITLDEFNKIPLYMRGRETMDDIQRFLEDIIIKSLTSKYTLLPKRREAVATIDIDVWSLYKSQESYFKGEKFITQGDICRLTNKQIDKKTNTRITILRHIKILREERKNSAVCYIWNGN